MPSAADGARPRGGRFTRRAALLLRQGEEVPRLVEALKAVLAAVAEVGLSAEQEVAHG